ncbi:murein biosynthesis integral membrane protein MurJ [Saccharopolyspora sp. MS10]|uniref:murein biosynthesis integral membrane protein MurJ n=1 Tax=Saccharopolyspora sp. MS10 TaxID=3385973 RepID=UPI0039A335D0
MPPSPRNPHPGGTVVEQARTPRQQPSLARAGSTMAIATIISRITGLAAKVALAAVLGLGMVNDSYTVANTLPTVVNELLLGGVLTSVAIPLLVRAQQTGPRAGDAYARWLITTGGVLMAAATLLAVATAPLLTTLYLGTNTPANTELTTAFAYLLLPAILFYGLSALLSAILNARHVFGPPAWAPVLNNLVVLATAATYALMPGTISPDPVRMGEPKLLVLGIGTALGIAAQSLLVAHCLRRTGFRYRWNWGWDHRLGEFAALAGWVVLYTLISQLGMIVTTRVAAQGTEGGVATFTYAWLLTQVPYGVLGVSLLTALMPRLSRSATDDDPTEFIADLSLGTRTSAVLLLPISALMLTAGGPLGTAFLTLGDHDTATADRLGATIGACALGIVPFAITMLQLRAFYAMKDARTPTAINLIMVLTRSALCYLFLATTDPDDLVIGVALAMSLSFVIGALAGQLWLTARLGPIGTRRSTLSLLRALTTTTAGCGCALAARTALTSALDGAAAAWTALLIDGTLVLTIAYGGLLLLKAPELDPLRALLTRRR